MMKPLSRLVIVATVLATVACFTSVANAEPAKDKRAQLEARLSKLRERVLKNEVGLDDKKANAVSAILARHFAERRKITKEQRDHRQALRKLLEKNSDDQKAYKKELDGFRAARNKLHALEDKQLDEVAKILTPKEQVKLVAALQKLRRKLAKKMGGRD